jgi:hypothetical protein
MKRFQITLFLFLALAIARAQPGKAKDSAFRDLLGSKSTVIRLEQGGPSLAKRSGPFSHFEVIDARADTLKIGIHADWLKLGASHNRQVILAGNAPSGIAGYLNARYATPDAPYAALIVLRTLWLSDAYYLHEGNHKDPDLAMGRTELRVKVEIYAVKENVYKPLFRFDSLQLSKKWSFNHIGQDLAAILDGMVDSAGIEVEKKWSKTRQLGMDDIRQFNQSRLNPPVVSDSALVKGVYASFEEFKNNAPSIQEYEIKDEKYGSSLYLKEPGGQSYYSHQAWGYCDGKKVYIMKDGALAAAWKYGKTWYFYSGIDDYRNDINAENYHPYMATPAGPGYPIDGPPVKMERHIFIVDMDSGNVY